MDRRDFLVGGVAAGAVLLGRRADAKPDASAPTLIAGQSAVVTPNGSTLPLRDVGGVKVGHLVAEEFDNEFAPGLKALCWGYNGSTPGPTIEAVEGDRMRLYVTNRLPEPTTVHWHGVIVPNGMDGVAGLTQKPIGPGETYVYELTFKYPGTFMYHPHLDEMTQIALGMVGMIVVHPRAARGPAVAHDYAIMLHEWEIAAGARRPNPLAMNDFNVLTMNGKSYPSTEPLLVKRGARVRIRFGNLGPMEHHPIHLHGVSFRVTATGGGAIAESAQTPETTVLVPVGSTRVIEGVFEEAGDWAMHCHMTHHVMTQMGHGAPSMIGANTRALDARLARVLPRAMTMGQTGMASMGAMHMPMPAGSAPMRPSPGPFSPIDMGGMFTIIKVRDNPTAADEKGWYAHPAGTVAHAATPAQMQSDGIDPNRR